MVRQLFNIFMLAICSAIYAQDTIAVPVTDHSAVTKIPKIVIFAEVGPSFRLAKISSDYSANQRAYIRDLKSGIAYNMSAYYLLDNQRGVGLKFSSYSSSGTAPGQELYDPTGEVDFGYSKDDITITFIGASYLLREKGYFALDHVGLEFALGYIRYVNETLILNDYKLSGGNLGISVAFNYHFGITKNFAIGPSLSFTGGVLNRFKVVGNGINETIKLEDDALESLYRLDLSVSGRFSF